MTNTEIKELVAILKQEGCNSKKQGKLKTFKIGDIAKIINPRYSYYKKMVKIVDISNRYIIVESDDKRFRRCLLEHDLEMVE